MFRALITSVVRRRRSAILVIAGTTAALGVLAGQLRIDNSLEVWFVEEDPTLLSYESFVREFGSDEVVVIALRGREDALDADRLLRLSQLTDELQNIRGVARVHSLTSLGHSVDANPVELQSAVARDGLASRLVGRDGKTLLVVAWMDASSDMDTERPRILDAIRDAASSRLAPDEQAHFGGVGVLHDALNRATIGEGTLFIGLSYLVIALVLLVVTRSFTWTLLALLVVTLADVALLGAMSLLGRPINMITVALPPVVMILGVANVVHMSTDLDLALAKGKNSLADLQTTLARVAVPCGFNAVTTGVAFLSLTTASMAVTRDYGLFAAIGVAFAFAYSLALMALVLPRASRMRRRAESTGSLGRLAETLMLASLRHPRLALAISGLIVSVSAVGANRIVVDTYSIGFLPDGDVVREDDRIIEEAAGPYFPMELTLRATGSDWHSKDFLDAVASAQVAVEGDPQIGRTTAVTDVLREVELAFTKEPIPRPWRPASEDQVRSAESWLRGSGNGDVLASFVAEDQRTIRLTANTPGMSVRNFVATADRARRLAQHAVGDRAEVATSGYLPLYAQMIDDVVGDQVRSFALAFAMVFVVVSLALRSWRLTLAAVPPNLLPVAILLGVMGFSGIRLDISTVTVAAVVLGVIVDDTIHILHRLRRELATGADLESAVRNVASASGLAVISTSLIFAAGFFAISLAASDAVANSGLLITVAILSALLTDLLLLPAFIALIFGRVSSTQKEAPA